MAKSPEIEIAKKAIELAEELGLIERLLKALRRKNRIIVLGATGVGKTNILQSLKEVAPKVIDRMNRTEFAVQRDLKISGNPFKFTDTPGQIEHKSRRLKAIREVMKEGEVGIINIVSYGFHEHRAATEADALNSDGSINEGFLEAHRQIEIDMLSEWVPLLGSSLTSSWLITLVSKADLWWDSRPTVESYYKTGEYSEALGDARSLMPIVLSYCSVFHKFYGRGTLSGSFDDDDRRLLRQNLFNTLISSIGKTDE